jgi:predicted nucleic acid-binding protein
MQRIFIDSSVLFSAAYSSKGYSRDLMMLGAIGSIKLVVSDFVLEETRSNLVLKQPVLKILEQIIQGAQIEIVSASVQQVKVAMKVVVPKDAPILAAARTARVDVLVSLDKKHLLGHPELESYLNAPILTPAEAIARIKEQQ